MTVDPAAARLQAVVEMPHTYPPHPDCPFQVRNQFSIPLNRGNGVARRKEMTRIQANSQPLWRGHSLNNPLQMLQFVPQTTPLPGRRLQVDDHGFMTGRSAVNLIQAGGNPVHSDTEAMKSPTGSMAAALKA